MQKIKRDHKDDLVFQAALQDLVAYKAREAFRLEGVRKEWTILKAKPEEKQSRTMKAFQKGHYVTVSVAVPKARRRRQGTRGSERVPQESPTNGRPLAQEEPF